MKIRKRRNPSGELVWVLDLGRGKGQRKTYPSKTKAEIAMAQEQRRQEKHGEMLADIMPSEMAEIVAARARLAAIGATISEAAEFYLGHGKRLQEPLLLSDLADRFRASRKRMDLSGKYVNQLKVSLDSLGTLFPATLAHDLTSKDIARWINAGTWAPKTRNNYLGDVSAMFEWALLPTQGHARVNPCAGVERERKKARGTVSTCTLEQARQMLEAAAAQKNWRVLAYCTLGLFGGLRPEEAAYDGLHWSHIDLREKHVSLTEEVVKTGGRRVVDLSDNAVAWLRLIPEQDQSAPVVPTKSWLETWRKFRHGLGWKVATEKGIRVRGYPVVAPVHGHWPKDVLRHTFASMHYAYHQNEAALQVQMGHRSAKMIHEHYRAVKTRQEAAEFWKLEPENRNLSA
jgi:integrase